MTTTIEEHEKVDEYQKKVREIAVAQCRCETGADLKSTEPKNGAPPREHSRAA